MKVLLTLLLAFSLSGCFATYSYKSVDTLAGTECSVDTKSTRDMTGIQLVINEGCAVAFGADIVTTEDASDVVETVVPALPLLGL